MRQKSILKIITNSKKFTFNYDNYKIETYFDILCDVIDEYSRLRKIKIS